MIRGQNPGSQTNKLLAEPDRLFHQGCARSRRRQLLPWEHVLAACRAASRWEIAHGFSNGWTKPQEQAFVGNAWLTACGTVCVRPDHGTHVVGGRVT